MLDLSNASPEELRKFLVSDVSDAALTPEQQLHRSAWALADAVQKDKALSQEELDAVVERFSRMLSNRSDLDQDSAEFIGKEAEYELNNAPPKWLPQLMQGNDFEAQDMPVLSEDALDVLKGSQLKTTADTKGSDGGSSTRSDPTAHPSKPLHQQTLSASADGTLTDRTNADDAASAKFSSLTAARVRDIDMQLDPTIEDAFDTELEPVPNKDTGMFHNTAASIGHIWPDLLSTRAE